jgi:hypothetical protein
MSVFLWKPEWIEECPSPVAADDGRVATSFVTQPDNAVFLAIALHAHRPAGRLARENHSGTLL